MSQAYTGVERRGVAEHFSTGIDITQSKYEADLPEPVKAALHVEPWMLRGGLAVVAAALCWSLNPFGLNGMTAIGVGLLLAAVILVIEMRLRWATPRGLLGGALGAVLGIFAAVLVTAVVSRIAEPERTKSFFVSGVLVAFAYLGAVLGSLKATERGAKKEGKRNRRLRQAKAVGTVARREGGSGCGDCDQWPWRVRFIPEAGGYERFDRWKDCGHLRGALFGWAAAGAGICPA